jgi:hypothetical protein
MIKEDECEGEKTLIVVLPMDSLETALALGRRAPDSRQEEGEKTNARNVRGIPTSEGGRLPNGLTSQFRSYSKG